LGGRPTPKRRPSDDIAQARRSIDLRPSPGDRVAISPRGLSRRGVRRRRRPAGRDRRTARLSRQGRRVHGPAIRRRRDRRLRADRRAARDRDRALQADGADRRGGHGPGASSPSSSSPSAARSRSRSSSRGWIRATSSRGSRPIAGIQPGREDSGRAGKHRIGSVDPARVEPRVAPLAVQRARGGALAPVRCACGFQPRWPSDRRAGR
jgi:hypothetical protein